MRAFVRTHWVGVIIVVVLSATVAQGAVRSPQDDLPAAQAPTSEPEFDWVTQAPQADGKQAKLQAKQQAKQEQENADPRLDALKDEAASKIDAELVQQMVDKIFSFGELGFQEFETSGYLKDILRENGFAIQDEIAGIPTAWMATWGSGKPVIALGSDIDGIPRSSQKPAVAYRAPLVHEEAPGHGEGHNSGQAVNIAAVLAVKEIMERENIKGTLKVWPGVAEELLGTKAWFVRRGFFKDVDVTLFSHVSNGMSTSWGEASGNGLVSVEWKFRGEPAHGANAAEGLSALDAVQLMTTAMEYRREHLDVTQRTHFVIPDGGDQPNLVAETARVWYYLREQTPEKIFELWDIARDAAKGAAKQTGTKIESETLLGSAWPQHMNRPVAEAAGANIAKVGMPTWSEADQTLAKAVQRDWGRSEATGLRTEPSGVQEPIPPQFRTGGGSDDIGDISWNTPTITLRYPANIPNAGPGHTWRDAIAMATPIAHKGSTYGAKVQAMTVLDLLLRPELVRDAWRYFEEDQTTDRRYRSFIRNGDKPAIHLNRERMEKWRPEMRKYYYDPSKYDTYLEQLGIDYPTVRR
jgi:aminobenzoyl-glutamate utilization protein B